MIEIIAGDKELFLYLNNLGSSEYDDFWRFVSGKLSWIPLYGSFLYGIYKNYPNRRDLLVVLLFLVLGLVASDQLSNVFKYGFERLRPCHDPSLQQHMRIVECGGRYGFYSAHASNTFLLASFLSMVFSKEYWFMRWFLFVWATVVAYSRIYLGVHFPLDIFVGATMGIIIGCLSAYFARRLTKKE